MGIHLQPMEIDASSRPRLRVGCAMWANRVWVGRYFPASTRSGEELTPYSTWCTTVEGNTTFYAEPPSETVARWAELAPPEFRFCFKVPRHLTHERRLRNVEDELHAFVDLLQPLQGQLGPVQLQLPPSFGSADRPALEDCLRQLPSAVAWAVEPRHPDFFDGGTAERPLNDLLAELGVNRVTLDSRALFTAAPVTKEEKEAWENKPRLPVRPVATASQPLVRLIGQSDLELSLASWTPWVEKLAEWVEAGVEPHVFTHTPDNGAAPELARHVWQLVADRVPDLEPLPEPTTSDEQLGLW